METQWNLLLQLNHHPGKAVSEFYASLVKTSGTPWVGDIDYLQGETSTAGLGSASISNTPGNTIEILPPVEGSLAPAGRLLGEKTQPQPSGSRIDRSIVLPKSNVGYKLLEKAGWKEGTGIGASEQGRLEPLQPDIRHGNVGLGFEKKGGKRKKAWEPTLEGKKSVDESGDNNKERLWPTGMGSTGPQHEQKPTHRPLPPDELADEDLETKVKRVKQVMQADVDDKAEKALAKLVYSAFRDGDGGPGGSTKDDNPLLRKNRKLSARNPLL